MKAGIIKILLLTILAISGIQSTAQVIGNKRFQNWHFGNHWVLNFSSFPPTANSNSLIYQAEGCASISSEKGNLLFYTNGLVVWDGNQDTMPNSIELKGYGSSSMSSIVAPVINKERKYYIITADQPKPWSSKGVYYSIVDMSLRNGLGDVDVSNKNILLTDSTNEKVAIVRAKKDLFWIITESYGKNEYVAFKVNQSGIDHKPVVSKVGLVGSSQGFLIPSSSGKHIANICYSSQGNNKRIVQLLNFDIETGKLYNPKVISKSYKNIYGLEFSPNDSFLYTTYFDDNSLTANLLRYEPFLSNPKTSEQLIAQEGPHEFGALSVGPDGALYVKNYYNLDVVLNPNKKNNYNYINNYIVHPSSTQFGFNGLPIFFDLWPNYTIWDTTICPGSIAYIGRDSFPGKSYQWTPSHSLSDSSSPNPLATPDITTTYTVVATGNGTSDTGMVTVTVQDTIIMDQSDTIDLCPPDTVTLRVSEGTVVQWFKNGDTIQGSTADTLAVDTPGIYTAHVEFLCQPMDTFTGVVRYKPAQPFFSSPDTVSICPGEYKGIVVYGGNLIRWKKGDSVITGNSKSIVVNTPGIYEAVIEDTCGLQDSGQVVVQYKSFPAIQFSLADSTVLCPGADTVLSATGGKVIHWKRNGSVITGAKDTFLTVSQEGTYAVKMKDTNSGCEISENIYIGELNPQAGLINKTTDTICPGGSTTLKALYDGSYSWQPKNIMNCDTCQSVTASPTQTTQVILTYENISGCVQQDTATITVTNKVNLQVSSDTTLCHNESTTLTATGADSITWQPASGLSCTNCQSTTASPTKTTTYTVIGYKKGGCSDTAQTTVTVEADPGNPIQESTLTICQGDTVTLNATGGISYEWSPKQNIINANTSQPEVWPTNNTTYTLTMTYGQQKSCEIEDSIAIQVGIKAGNLPSDTTVCEGQPITYEATGFDSILWEASFNIICNTCPTLTITPYDTTTVKLTAKTKSGCEITKEITAYTKPRPDIVITGPDSLCPGDTAQLQVSGAQSYEWFPKNAIIEQTGQIFPTQTTSYIAEGTGTNGCKATQVHTVFTKQLPSVTATQDTLICLGQSTPLQASGAQSYQWSPDTTINCTTCDNIIATPKGDLTYTVTGTAQNGCKNTDTVKVDVSPNPIVTVPNDTTICKGDTIQIRALDNNQHEWAPQNQVDCPTCDTVTVSPTSKTVFTVTAYGPESCTASDTVVVGVQKPQITTSSDTTVCPDDNFTLSATGAQTYEWQPVNQTDSALETSTSQTAVYTVTGFDNLGCTDTAQIQVTVHDTIDPQITGDTIACPGDTLTWNISEGQSAYWPNLDTNGMALTLSPITPLTLSPSITDSNGCTYTRTKTLKIHPQPTLTVTPDQTIRQYEEIQLEATGASTYKWNPESNLNNPSINKPTFQSLQTGIFTYTITGYNEYGCKDTAQLIITVEPKPEIVIPNAFSPNGDGINDRFTIKLPQGYQLLEMQIFNRWGELIFQSNDPNATWNGRINGQIVPLGTYAVIIKYQDDRGELITKKGNVTVVR